MKKLVCLIAMVMMCFSAVFAATQGAAEGAVGDNPEASTQVTLDLSADTGDAYVKLWFEGKSTNTSFEDPKKSVSLKFEGDSAVASNSAEGSNDALYACWEIVSGNTVTVQLALKDKLTSSGNKIDWNVTWTDSGKIDSKTLSQEKTEDVADLPAGTRTGLVTTGKTQLTISTDSNADFTNLSAGSYTADLILKLKTN